MSNQTTKFDKTVNVETVKAWMIKNYVRTSGASLLAFDKPMQNIEHVAIFPISIEVLDALTTCEYNENAHEWRLRFRPSNGVFVRASVKFAQGHRDMTLCTTDELKTRKEIETEKFMQTCENANPRTIGMGHAFESLLAEKWGSAWFYDCTPYYIAGDIFTPDGVGVQCKRYGGSISETSIVTALMRKGWFE